MQIFPLSANKNVRFFSISNLLTFVKSRESIKVFVDAFCRHHLCYTSLSLTVFIEFTEDVPGSIELGFDNII